MSIANGTGRVGAQLLNRARCPAGTRPRSARTRSTLLLPLAVEAQSVVHIQHQRQRPLAGFGPQAARWFAAQDQPDAPDPLGDPFSVVADDLASLTSDINELISTSGQHPVLEAVASCVQPDERSYPAPPAANIHAHTNTSAFGNSRCVAVQLFLPTWWQAFPPSHRSSHVQSYSDA